MTAEKSRPRLTLLRPGASEPAPEGFDALYERYGAYVAGTAARLLGRQDGVDDVVQEVFLAVVRTEPRFATAEDARRWMSAVTSRVAMRWLAKWRWKRRLSLRTAEARAVPAPGASPEQRALLHRVYELLDELPAEARAAWILRRMAGEKLEDVARTLGFSLATAKRRIARADALLAEVLDDG
ncbi:MAG TPA: sigma-70 family RNA polymerase sigma factor [Sandaracinaceae bacterium LLY-WYZ-13_1]|nr:sigma-70 family RNA polymerase sigma factor [Sandaracinaceae bacterium LLY-WYZ-13_1]